MTSPVTSTPSAPISPGISLDSVIGHIDINAMTQGPVNVKMHGCAGIFKINLQSQEPPAKKRKISQITSSSTHEETPIEWIDANDAPEELLEVLDANKENFAQVVVERPDITIKSNEATYEVSVNGKNYKVFYKLGIFTSFAEFRQASALN